MARYRLAWRGLIMAVLLAATVPAVSGTASAHDTCGQPTNIYVVTSPNRGILSAGSPALTVDTNTTLMFAAGSVHRDTRVYWGLYDPLYQRRFFHITQPARSNCVVHQEPEAVRASLIGAGVWEVWAIYIRWESNPNHLETSARLGTLTINNA